ncbi:carbohydrate esterase family 4 protein [Crepidotus variabilis]|uniref:chitin deacetylase n=1 Tax=Crepidotus variabilis TaxID=179855 RepID=A0A9P6EKG0_9AGAR|nr:carbohydrate esterase family 4 protein [Crepidotus variabilis]
MVNAAGSFPPLWTVAHILPEDANAQAKWSAIKDSVPPIDTKPAAGETFDAAAYPPDDPDCWWTATKCTKPKVANVPEDIYVVPEPRTLGYGFDDGPNCTHNAFYDYLKKENQKATMFFIGSNVMDWPLEAQRAVKDGHEVCVHGWSHQAMTSLPSEDVFAELYYTQRSCFLAMQSIKIAAGVTCTCWRPPYGDVDDRVRAIAHGLGLRNVLWNTDSEDWQVGSTPNYTPELVDAQYQGLIDDCNKGVYDQEGAMLLMHELNDFTMSTAMKWHGKLKATFKSIVPVCVANNITQPYVEKDIKFPTFEEYIKPANKLATNVTRTSTTTTATGATKSPTPTTRQTANTRRNAWAADMKAVLFIGIGLVFAI